MGLHGRGTANPVEAPEFSHQHRELNCWHEAGIQNKASSFQSDYQIVMWRNGIPVPYLWSLLCVPGLVS